MAAPERAAPLPRGKRGKCSQDDDENSSTVHNCTIPLRALQARDASPAEIRARLRLNLAIRILLDAIAERAGVA
jgi:hypothetical protein